MGSCLSCCSRLYAFIVYGGNAYTPLRQQAAAYRPRGTASDHGVFQIGDNQNQVIPPQQHGRQRNPYGLEVVAHNPGAGFSQVQDTPLQTYGTAENVPRPPVQPLVVPPPAVFPRQQQLGWDEVRRNPYGHEIVQGAPRPPVRTYGTGENAPRPPVQPLVFHQPRVPELPRAPALLPDRPHVHPVVAREPPRAAAPPAHPEYVLSTEHEDHIDEFLRTHDRYDSQVPLEFKCPILEVYQNFPERERVGIARFASGLSRSPRFVVDPARQTVSVRYLTPHRGENRVFGMYYCKDCGRNWRSAGSWRDSWQKCQLCEAKIYPHIQQPLQYNVEDADRPQTLQPHDCQRCQRCKELGELCLPARYYAI